MYSTEYSKARGPELSHMEHPAKRERQESGEGQEDTRGREGAASADVDVADIEVVWRVNVNIQRIHLLNNSIRRCEYAIRLCTVITSIYLTIINVH